MTRIQELEEQAARAERLARSILDTVTVERLLAFAAECRQQMQALTEAEVELAWSQRLSPQSPLFTAYAIRPSSQQFTRDDH
jgi:hypothetical protein